MDWMALMHDPAYQWLTTRDAARRLRDEHGVTVETRYLRDGVRKGRLPGFQLDGMWFVDWLTLSRRFGEAIRDATGE